MKVNSEKVGEKYTLTITDFEKATGTNYKDFSGYVTLIFSETYTKEDFEDCPRFMPMQYESEIYENGKSLSWYIFDTEKLEFLPDIVPYHDYKECENACNILVGVDYILNGDVE